jgi:di/tricarboxylate transporter
MDHGIYANGSAVQLRVNAAFSYEIPLLEDNNSQFMLVLRMAVTCSFAFMLPVATPPNAIVYSASGMRTSEMMAAGSIMNVICVAVTVLGTTS